MTEKWKIFIILRWSEACLFVLHLNGNLQSSFFLFVVLCRLLALHVLFSLYIFHRTLSVLLIGYCTVYTVHALFSYISHFVWLLFCFFAEFVLSLSFQKREEEEKTRRRQQPTSYTVYTHTHKTARWIAKIGWVENMRNGEWARCGTNLISDYIYLFYFCSWDFYFHSLFFFCLILNWRCCFCYSV